jgi:hypothetical protein
MSTENRVDWTPIVLAAGAAAALYYLWKNKGSVGSALCSLTGGAICSAANAYVNATSCCAIQAQGNVILPDGQQIATNCLSIHCYCGTVGFTYQGQNYSLAAQCGGNYQATAVCCL